MNSNLWLTCSLWGQHCLRDTWLSCRRACNIPQSFSPVHYLPVVPLRICLEISMTQQKGGQLWKSIFVLDVCFCNTPTAMICMFMSNELILRGCRDMSVSKKMSCSRLEGIQDCFERVIKNIAKLSIPYNLNFNQWGTILIIPGCSKVSKLHRVCMGILV